MAEILNSGFGGTALGAEWTPAHLNGGTHAVGGGQLTLSTPNAAGAIARVRQASPVAMADGDTLTVDLVSVTPFRGFIGLVSGTAEANFRAGFVFGGAGQWGGGFWRAVGGQLPRFYGTATRYARLRRAGANLVVETSTNGTSFTVVDSLLATDGAWQLNFASVQVELVAYDESASLVLEQIGTAPPPTPQFDSFRFVGGVTPWAPQPNPTTGQPYSFQVEAWDSVLAQRDTAFTGTITLGLNIVTPPPTVIGGDPSETAVAGVASFSNIVFDAPPTPAPTITGFTPTSGPAGTSIVVTGTNLTGALASAVNGLAASVTAQSATQATIIVPAGATSGVLSITTPGGTATSSGSFTVTTTPAPTPGRLTYGDLALLAEKRVRVAGRNVPRDLLLRRIGVRQAELYLRIATWNPEYAAACVVAQVTDGAVNLRGLVPPLADAASVLRVQVETATPQALAQPPMAVSLVPLMDPDGGLPPRATIRDKVLRGFNGELAGVTSARIWYARLSQPVKPEDVDDPVDLDEPWVELLVLDGARYLCEQLASEGMEVPGPLREALAAEEAARLADFEGHVKSYIRDGGDRFWRAGRGVAR